MYDLSIGMQTAGAGTKLMIGNGRSLQWIGSP